jgi:hypothetical protein
MRAILARTRGVTPVAVALLPSEFKLKSGINRNPYALHPFIPF